MTTWPSSIVAEDAREIADSLPADPGPLAGGCVLVTGSTGMVGSYVVAALLEVSDRLDGALHVVAHARNPDKARRLFSARLGAANFELAVGDTADPASLPRRAVTHVVHAASPATPSQFRDDPVGVIRANALGTAVLLDYARERGAYLSLISTMEVYGAVPRTGTSDLVIDEDAAGVLDSLDLRSAYPESKRVAENLCVAYGAQYGVRSDIVRLSHTYGPGMDLADTRVQAEFLRKALAGQDIVLSSDGSASRTYTYIADAAAAVLAVLLTAPARAEPRAFNVADESSRTTIRGLAELVLHACGLPADRLRIEAADPSGRLWSKVRGGTFLDCSRVRALGWAPRRPLPDGLARTVAHHREVGQR